MIKILTALHDVLLKKEPAILASVVVSSGATPRSEGAHMVVSARGLEAGTIGGGSVEYQSISKAEALLKQGRSDSHHYVLNQSDVEALGMICGGDAVIRFLFLSPENPGLIETIEAGIEALTDKRPGWLVTGLHGGRAVFLLYIDNRLLGDAAGLDVTAVLDGLAGKRGRRITLAENMVAEAMTRAGRVVIFGGGHVGMALAHVLAPLEFEVVVLDDRDAFVDPARYPESVETHLVDLTDIAASFALSDEDYVCVMTRGHKFDENVQIQVLRTSAHYIGVIGSRYKMKTIFANLKAEHGFTDRDLARITSPIGLDIGAETPEEIAVSITAQLIAVRAKKERARS